MPSYIPNQILAWALDEKYPYHWGAMMTVAVVTSRLSQCEQGTRRQWVDLLTELREADCHAHAVLSKRFTRTSSKPWELVPAKTETPAEEANAREIASFVAAEIEAIPQWRQHVHGMLWAGYTGASARETMWRRDNNGFHIDRLRLVHSRRIDLGDDFVPLLSNGSFLSESIDPAKYPGKFVVHLPCFADEHPSRGGLGRVLAYWMAFKRFCARDFVGYVERFGKPFPIVTWATGRKDSGTATDAEITAAKELAVDVGRGSQPGWAGPDVIGFELAGPGGTASSGGSGENTVHKAFLALCNAEISKAVEGGDIGTQTQESGSRALGDSQADSAEGLSRDDAGQLDETITRDVVRWLVEYNYGPDAARRYLPRYHTIVEKPEDAKRNAEVLDIAVNKIGVEVPVVWAHEKLSIPRPQDDEEVIGKAEPVPTPLAPFTPQQPNDDEPGDGDTEADDDEPTE